MTVRLPGPTVSNDIEALIKEDAKHKGMSVSALEAQIITNYYEGVAKKTDCRLDFDLLVSDYGLVAGRTVRAINKYWTMYRSRRKTFNSQEIHEAMMIMLEDEFLQGNNDRGKVYGDLEFLLRSDTQIEKLLNNKNAKKRKEESARKYKINDKEVSKAEMIEYLQRNNIYHSELNPN